MKKHYLIGSLVILILLIATAVIVLAVQNQHLIREMGTQIQDAQKVIATQQADLSSTTQKLNELSKKNNSSISQTTLASAKKDCSDTASKMASHLKDAQALTSNYQSFFNPRTSTCYLRLSELEPPSFMGTRYSVYVVSFRDAYSNTLLASCVTDTSKITETDNKSCVDSTTGQSMTFDQYSKLEDYYIGN